VRLWYDNFVDLSSDGRTSRNAIGDLNLTAELFLHVRSRDDGDGVR
jgi:hypothetical protein